MDTQTEITEKKTLETPVSAEDLAKFAQLQGARLQVAERVLDLEQEKVRALRAAASIDSERQKLFEKILTERGLPAGFPVEIDSKTGLMTPVEGAMEAFVRQQATQVPSVMEASPVTEAPVQVGLELT
jgi:hypothetical protein